MSFRAGRAALRNFPRAKPKGNPEEQPCKPEEKSCPSQLIDITGEARVFLKQLCLLGFILYFKYVFFNFAKYRQYAEQTLFRGRLVLGVGPLKRAIKQL